MNRRTLYLSLLALTVSACSTVETRKQAKGEFDYVNQEVPDALVVPAHLNNPERPSEYEVPPLQGTAGPVGEELDIRAPALVLALASGSRIDEFDQTAQIWFDKIDDDSDLYAVVVGAIENYLQEEGVELTSKQGTELKSDWFHQQTTSGFWLWEDVSTSESWRFKYSLVTKPHGRSIGLNVDLIDYKSADGSSQIDPIEQQRVEMAMINAVSAQLDYEYRLNLRDQRLAKANRKVVAMGSDEQGQSAYLVDYPRQEFWDMLPQFFEKYNFSVTDLNESKYVYMVNYERNDPSLWEGIWGDAVDVIDLDDGSYEFHLVAKDKKTLLKIYNDQKQLLSETELESNFDIMSSALSFN
ncbi:outer membrane protein assembly factor BamC [Thalassotalea mangrovi]|uniref:Outer membrane protein assembly factor BamC n=1 Tax=Thalassotalea mangrovi TaxID=2572245 RepID=A0A4U1B3M6_9GAMM|nr:outer membrane protein assembly factor BamC [Thalassotalea mangrovi]TKB44360.1 outer membrane protein assembly factor BamC [Thalassotalea mangrovi]